MIGLMLLQALAGPPALPPLPAERRAEQQAKQEAEAAEDLDEAQEPAAQDASAASDTEPSTKTAGPRTGSPPSGTRRPKNTVALGAIAAKAKEASGPLEDASGEELSRWAVDDEIEEEAPEADASLRAAAVPGNRPRAPRAAPVRTATGLHTQARLEQPGKSTPPRRSSAFVFGYRLFQTQDAFARQQSWHVGSVEVTPVRRFVRLNLITEVGAEGGAAARGGDRADIFFLQKAGLGLQYPHWLTPFVEFQGGAGVARVEVFDRSDVLLMWTLGVDAGAQWAVTRWMSLHAAVGWIRPTFKRPEQTVFHNAFTFKLGVGF